MTRHGESARSGAICSGFPPECGSFDAVPETMRLDEAAQGAPAGRRSVSGVLGDLFPASAPAPRRPLSRRVIGVAAQVAAVALGALVLLERIPGLPSWDTIYAEDYWKFFPQALQRPWQLFIPYGGYEELLPRVIAQLATYLPLPQVSRWDAVSGAVIAAACGLFVFHASAGHVRSKPLRALLGAAVVLLPVAPMEIADSAVAAPWYLMLALFWALLWRPRTRAGMAAAALVAFAATSSEVTMVLFAPLVAARLFALRRPREHAVTAGWAAGLLVQLPVVLLGTSGQSRLAGRPEVGRALALYAHDVVLTSISWHLAERLQSLAGSTLAIVIVAAILAVIIGSILLAQPASRPFVVAAVATGLLFYLFDASLNPRVHYPAFPDYESGSRYTDLPIFLFECVAVVGVDHVLRRRREARGRRGTSRRGTSLRAVAAVSALVAVLGAAWIADFRYPGYRSEASWNWGPIAATWLHDCALSASGEITVHTAAQTWTLPCDRIRP